MPFLDFNSGFILILEDLWWFWVKSLLTWIHFTKKLVKKFQKNLSNHCSRNTSHNKTEVSSEFQHVNWVTSKWFACSALVLKTRATQLSWVHHTGLKLNSRQKLNLEKNSWNWVVINDTCACKSLTNFEYETNKSSEICIRFFWTFVISMKTNYFSADFSDLKPLCIMPATQAHASLLSLGRQKFCLEVEEEY